MPDRCSRVAYVHYGAQSGVTPQVAAALRRRGHPLALVAAAGVLEPRDPRTRRLRPTPPVIAHLVASALRFGRRALHHRWNTPYAFDRHSASVEEVGSSRVDLQACKLEYSIVSPK